MQKPPHHPLASRSQALLLLLVLALAARLPVWLGSHGASFDLESYARVAAALGQGHSLYGDPALQGRYPYLPAWGLIVAGLTLFSSWSGLASHLSYKLPALLGDLGITLLLYLIMERLTQGAKEQEPAWTRRPFWIAAAYAANPLSLLIGVAHGQFDSLPLFFILLACWYFEFSENPSSDFLSALSLGAAIALKSWPFFLLPLFLKNLNLAPQQRRFLFFSLLPPLLLLLPFVRSSDFQALWKALSYTGSQALSLPEALRSCFYGAGASEGNYQVVAGVFKAAALSCFFLVFGLYGLSSLRFPLLPGLALGVLTFYVFAVGLASQYLLWLLPFALLLPGRLALKHTFFSLLLLLAFYGLFMPEVFLREGTWRPAALPAWAFLIWAAANLSLWVFFVVQWAQLFRLCRRPKGRLEFH
jgi:hypothetical protein